LHLIKNKHLKLSICIATYNRGDFIGETLDSILSQMSPEVELVIVDGASPDNTPEVMAEYVSTHPEIRYYREKENSGVDADFDKVVGYARGDYCWLMTDDDFLHPNALKRVIAAIEQEPELVVVNSEVRNADLSSVLKDRILPITDDRQYGVNDNDKFYRESGSYLSFIGAVVIRRELWLRRDRASYYGTLFIHFGVIFQHTPIKEIYVISEPLIILRYGNAMWKPRGFEIWMFKWPQLVWSFNDFSDDDKLCITALEPWRNLRELFYYRAIGAYSSAIFYSFISPHLQGISWFKAYSVSIFPGSLANIIYVCYFALTKRASSMTWYEFLNCQYATKLSHWVAKKFR